MPVQIDFYFDFVSPYTYLANTQLPRLAAAHDGAMITYHPFDLRALMAMVGNRPTTVECKNKGTYAAIDLQRWAKRYKVGLAFNPRWVNIDFAELGRGALVASDDGRAADYINAVFAAIWVDTVDLTRRNELIGVLDRAGLDGERLLARAGSAQYVGKLDSNTSAAAARGVFGSPTLLVGDAMFFGNDRFDFVTEALQAAA